MERCDHRLLYDEWHGFVPECRICGTPLCDSRNANGSRCMLKRNHAEQHENVNSGTKTWDGNPWLTELYKYKY